MEIKQYQLLLVCLDPTLGSEIRKTRPCLVVSPDEMNTYLNTLIVAPVTSRSKDYPTRIRFDQNKNANWIALDQIRTIDKVRVVKILGSLDEQTILSVKQVLFEMLGQ